MGQYQGRKSKQKPKLMLYPSFLLAFPEIQFDERTFARKVVKIFRTMRKMEQSKHLEPFMSHSFQELSDVLLQNYKDSSSAGSSVFGSLPVMSGINN